MTAKEIETLKNLGFDINRPKEEIFSNLVKLADYLYKELSLKEQDRFIRDIKRLTKLTN